jgi:hypothetical protein
MQMPLGMRVTGSRGQMFSLKICRPSMRNIQWLQRISYEGGGNGHGG